MKTHSFSIVVGTAECDACCPFCVSKMTQTHAPSMLNPYIDWSRFHKAMKIVEMAAHGAISVILTGKGEPTLYPKQISDYLDHMDHRFPLVDLQTNGINIVDMPDTQLMDWNLAGLSLVCISIAHHDPKTSGNIMRCPAHYNFWDAVKKVQDAGLTIRLNCTMVKDGCDTEERVDKLISRCAEQGVDQLTLRAVDKPKVTKAKGPFDWVCDNQPDMSAFQLYDYLCASGTELLWLPHGAVVFDIDGQNVCVGNCLTASTDREDIRQLIFFPSGSLGYDWQFPGARIL